MNEGLITKFNVFVQQFGSKQFEEFILKNSKTISISEFNEYLIVAIDEARYGLSELQQQLNDQRILEVGSGMGILTSFLAKEGFNITGIEPGGIGFENNINYPELIKEFTSTKFDFYPISIEEIEKNQLGKFDLIFSVNVMEHVKDFDQCLSILNDTLTDSGKMIHVCPNYFVPYEPHYNIFLLPFASSKTHYVLPKRITNQNLWRSLNFISYFKIKRSARKAGASSSFKKHTLYEAFSRLGMDPEFTKRHRGFVSGVFKFMKFTRLIVLLKLIPPSFATPMVFNWKKKDR